MTETWPAVVLALASALSQAFGTVMRHRPAGDTGHGGEGRFGVLTSKTWWAGMGISLAGFTFQGLALSFGSLILVQTLTVLSLSFALPLGAWFTGRQPTKTELFWGMVLTTCVVVLVVYGRPAGGDSHPPWYEWALACGVGALVVGVLIHLARGRLRGDRALMLGLAGGITFAYVALFTKGAVERFAVGGFTELVGTGELYGLVITAVAALTLQQASFSAGAVHQSVPASTVTTPVIALLLGAAVLGERFAVDGAELALLGLTVVVMAVATVLLSRKDVDT